MNCNRKCGLKDRILKNLDEIYEKVILKKRATLLAFGEIGYEGGLGEVASAAVIG